MIQDLITDPITQKEMVTAMLNNPKGGIVHSIGQVLALAPELDREETNPIALVEGFVKRKRPEFHRLKLESLMGAQHKQIEFAIAADHITCLIAFDDFVASSLPWPTELSEQIESSDIYTMRIALNIDFTKKVDGKIAATVCTLNRTRGDDKTQGPYFYPTPLPECEGAPAFVQAVRKQTLGIIANAEISVGETVIERPVDDNTAPENNLFAANSVD